MLVLNTPAKINLFLNLRGIRPDGYHDVGFVMQAIDLYDTLTISPRLGSEQLRFTCNVPELEDLRETNLVVRAFHYFWEYTGLPPMGLHVHLEKRIPVQAGLGGGSSDAAAMLTGLNRIILEPLPAEDLSAIAAKLGSDVPFFLTGGTAIATGRGEIIEPVESGLPEFPLVIVKPRHLGISTPAAYQAVQAKGYYEEKLTLPLLQAIAHAATPEDIETLLWNDFEPVLFERYPQLPHMAGLLRNAGVAHPLLSGSGPAMFGFIEDTPGNRTRLAERFPEATYELYWAKTIRDGIKPAESLEPAVLLSHMFQF
jgi:4-diphosphocytidyl-2-C-methyl-D-erythritol kinase